VGNQAILIARIKAKAESLPNAGSGGTNLPELTNPATAGNVVEGMDFIDGNGNRVVGEVVERGSEELSFTQISYTEYSVVGLSGFYIDGIDITTIGLRKLRESMCIVPQDPTLIEGTLRDNVDPLGKYTDDEIIQVLEELDFFGVMKSNKRNTSSNTVTNARNLHFKIKEFGNNMSLGEKQLVCFARAILKRAKIIFLDEATASLDQRTEDIIQKAIEKYFKECTVLTIAHRVQTIKKCDKILVLDKGKVVEFDKPEVLLQNATGLFYKLYYKGLQNVDE
jgi:ABC-type multidrug transport system fused ATPase/permease subunit